MLVSRKFDDYKKNEVWDMGHLNVLINSPWPGKFVFQYAWPYYECSIPALFDEFQTFYRRFACHFGVIIYKIILRYDFKNVLATQAVARIFAAHCYLKVIPYIWIISTYVVSDQLGHYVFVWNSSIDLLNILNELCYHNPQMVAQEIFGI